MNRDAGFRNGDYDADLCPHTRKINVKTCPHVSLGVVLIRTKAKATYSSHSSPHFAGSAEPGPGHVVQPCSAASTPAASLTAFVVEPDVD